MVRRLETPTVSYLMQTQPNLWQFDRVAAQDAERAKALRAAPSRTEIARQVATALGVAVSNGDVRLGLEESGTNANHLRAVIQFHVGKQIFDWFFNAHTGYRVQFRIGWENGHTYNIEIVSLLRAELLNISGSEVLARRLNASFEDIGPEQTLLSCILTSLQPELSKVWFCKKLIHPDGRISNLPIDLYGPRLVFDEYESWAAPYADEPDAWLDLKGAFLGASGLYQVKDPIFRAKELQRFGTT